MFLLNFFVVFSLNFIKSGNCIIIFLKWKMNQIFLICILLIFLVYFQLGFFLKKLRFLFRYFFLEVKTKQKENCQNVFEHFYRKQRFVR